MGYATSAFRSYKGFSKSKKLPQKKTKSVRKYRKKIIKAYGIK